MENISTGTSDPDGPPQYILTCSANSPDGDFCAWVSIATPEVCKLRDYKGPVDLSKIVLPKLSRKQTVSIAENKRDRRNFLVKVVQKATKDTQKATDDKEDVIYQSKSLLITKYSTQNSSGYITKLKKGTGFSGMGYSVFGESKDPPYVFYEYHSTYDFNTGAETDEVTRACMIVPCVSRYGTFTLALHCMDRSGPKIPNADDLLALSVLAKSLRIRSNRNEFVAPMKSFFNLYDGSMRVAFIPEPLFSGYNRSVEIGYFAAYKGRGKILSYSAYVRQE